MGDKVKMGDYCSWLEGGSGFCHLFLSATLKSGGELLQHQNLQGLLKSVALKDTGELLLHLSAWINPNTQEAILHIPDQLVISSVS